MAVVESVACTLQRSEEVQFGSVPDHKVGLRQAKLAAAMPVKDNKQGRLTLMEFASKRGRGRRASRYSVSRARFEQGTFQIRIVIVITSVNLLGKTIRRFTYILHVICKLLYGFFLGPA